MQTPPRISQQTTSDSARRRLSNRSLVKLLVLTTGIVLSAVYLRALFPALPAGAYPVLSTARWARRNRVGSAHFHYKWLANGDLAYLEPGTRGALQVCYQKIDNRGPVGALRRGPELPSIPGINNFLPSPDERWVAYHQLSNSNQYQTVLISANGKTPRTFPGLLAGWLPDSRGLLTAPGGGQSSLNIYYLDSPGMETIPGDAIGGMIPPTGPLSDGQTFLIGSSFYRPLVKAGMPLASPAMTMRSFSTSRPAIPLETWQPALPPAANFGTAHASPDGKLLLWTIWSSTTSWWKDWLQRLIPAWRSAPHKTEYYVSDLHGNNLRPVANRLTVGAISVDLTWTPDSKHLSFVYREQLYLLPVE